VKWRADEQIHSVHYEDCALPAPHVNGHLDERHEQRAGESADERERRDGGLVMIVRGADQHGKSRRIERHSHRRAHQSPSDEENGFACGPERPQQKASAAQ